MKLKNRILSFILVLALCIGLVPVSAYAEELPDYVPGFTVEVTGGKYAWPVPGSNEVTQGFAVSEHEALDIGAGSGSSVLAAEAGTVAAVQEWDGVTTEGNQSYGNMVQIIHEDGNTTLYAHLSSVTVAEGDSVERGQEIGLAGQTGNATGSHLHFEVRTETGRVSPVDYITGGVEDETPVEEAPAEEIAAEGVPAFRLPGGNATTYSVGEHGTLRNLYYCFPEDVTIHMDSIGDICGMPAHSLITGDGKTMKAAYCLNQERSAFNGTDYTWETAEQNGKTDIVGTIIALGFQYTGQPGGNPPTPWGRGDSNDKWAVTQILVWAALNGHIFVQANHLIGIEAMVDADMQRASQYAYNPSGFIGYYNNLKKKLKDFRQIPSFASYPDEGSLKATAVKPINLKWDGTAYTATVTDKNDVLKHFTFAETLHGVSITKSGNTLSLSSAEEIPVSKTSKTVTYLPQGGRNAVACWRTSNHDSSQQDFAVFYADGYDPVNAVITVTTSGVPTGEAGLVKISEDGIVDGLTFEITGSDGKSYTRTTSGGGRISLDGIPIYVEEPVLDGSGNPVLDELTGDALTTKGDRITYTAREVNTPIRYVIPASQTFQLYEGQEVSLQFENRLKKWRVTVTKSDRETGSTPQGDATLGGAVYGVYHNGVLQDSYTTDSSGRFTTKYYVCGTGWTLKEITPSEGYLLNVGTSSIGMTPGETTVEYNSTSDGEWEQVIKGKVGITKHTDDGSTQIETPETGAKFEVYLSSAGSYEKAKATERDTITIGENGYGETKLLPYGMYTVHQIDGWEGKEMIPDFQVFIAEDGKTYSFIVNNHVFEALIQIVKKDSETGKVIPASGIGFKIKDLTSGKWVSQHINYPTPMDLDTFYTDITGRLMLPAPLTYGAYELYEQQSAYGYVISKDPVPFSVDGTAKTVVVEMGNKPQKGILTLHKTGEVFQSVKNTNGTYQPIYEVGGLKGAVYAMCADEDVKTPDGTLRYAYGELIEKVETGADGTAKFPAVYLGKYRVVEETAPFGYVLDPTVYHVEFTYAGQEIAMVTEALDCYDQRQKVEIGLEKSLETDEVFQIGNNGEYENIRFGLFASENIQAADGKVIPTGGLIEEISLAESMKGYFTADLPLGSYYVQETATDGHYILSDRKYLVVFEYAGQKKSVVKIEVDDGNPIENTLKRGRLQGHKSDEDDLFLPGAVFGLFSPDTETFTEETALVTATTAANGEFAFDNIPIGRWVLREIAAPEGFVLDETSYEVNITEDGQVVEYSLTNFFIRGDVTLTKVDADYPENKLSGAVFAIYDDSNSNKEFDPGDVKLCTLTEENGVYGMADLRYGGYYCVEEKAPEYFVADPAPIYFEIVEDGETVTLANRDGCFINRPQTGALQIVKTSEDGKISGIEFHVSGTALTGQSYEQTLFTDENGEIFIPDLRIGSYTVSEVGTENTVQYVLPADKVLALTYGETVTAEFYNRLKRGSIFGQKNGEDGKPLAGVVFGIFPADATDFAMKNAVATAQTFEDGSFIFKDIAYGHWLVMELETLPGYVLLKEPVAVEITEDGQEIHLDPIVNEHTKVEISKQDMTTGKELPGAKLQLFDETGKLIEEWVSADEPHLIERLPAGKYRLHEETAPDGYTVAEDVEFTVEATGEIQRVVMKDAPKSKVPNTGENPLLFLMAGVFVLSAGAGAGSLLLRLIKRKLKRG